MSTKMLSICDNCRCCFEYILLFRNEIKSVYSLCKIFIFVLIFAIFVVTLACVGMAMCCGCHPTAEVTLETQMKRLWTLWTLGSI